MTKFVSIREIMLSFAAITPHPPIIIPSIGKENLRVVEKTAEAMKKLEEKFIKTNSEIIIIISPHSPIFADAFCLNLSDKFEGNFHQFGDFTTKMNFAGNLELTYQLRKKLAIAEIPLNLITEVELDHGSLVPLYYLTKNFQPKADPPRAEKNFSIIPIGYSLLDFQKHFEFGEKIKEEIALSNKRVAVIASGDLSHRLTFDAPAGYSPKGKIFDQKLISLIKKKNTNAIFKLDPSLIEEAGECGLRSIIILLGVLKNLNYQPEILSYESPFGVGYLVANFKMSAHQKD